MGVEFTFDIRILPITFINLANFFTTLALHIHVHTNYMY